MRDNKNINSLIVLTGGPGSGKSTIINILKNKGYYCCDEAGRAIIQHQVAINGNALPWKSPSAFAELMLSWEMRSYSISQQTSSTVFFDRAIPDVGGYLNLMQIAVPEHVKNAINQYRYNKNVFITPPWQAIFSQDSERKQTFEESVQTYYSMINIYTQYGYQLIEIPLLSPIERVEFILEEINKFI